MSQMIERAAFHLPLLSAASGLSRAIFAIVALLKRLFEIYKMERREIMLVRATAHLDRHLLRDIGLGDEAG